MYRVLYLQTGVMILATMINGDVDYGNYTVEISNPVYLEPVRMQQGTTIYETYVMKSWMPMTEGNNIHLQTSHIISSIPLKETYEKQYVDYLEHRKVHIEEMSKKFDPFGNTPSSDDDEEFLPIENLYDDNDNEDEDNKNYEDPKRRTLH